MVHYNEFSDNQLKKLTKSHFCKDDYIRLNKYLSWLNYTSIEEFIRLEISEWNSILQDHTNYDNYHLAIRKRKTCSFFFDEIKKEIIRHKLPVLLYKLRIQLIKEFIFNSVNIDQLVSFYNNFRSFILFIQPYRNIKEYTDILIRTEAFIIEKSESIEIQDNRLIHPLIPLTNVFDTNKFHSFATILEDNDLIESNESFSLPFVDNLEIENKPKWVGDKRSFIFMIEMLRLNGVLNSEIKSINVINHFSHVELGEFSKNLCYEVRSDFKFSNKSINKVELKNFIKTKIDSSKNREYLIIYNAINNVFKE